MALSHRALRVRENEQWRDVHHANAEVRCTRCEVTPKAANAAEQLAEVGGAVRAVVQHAFDSDEPLRVAGGRWSLSTIGKPKRLLLDLASYRRVAAVPASWLTPEFTTASHKTDVTPMFISGSTTVNVVNRELAKKKLALKTSGASDGQTFAGAIATGTHGADLNVGALHDTVLALHLVVAPDRSVLIQASAGGLNQRAADTLARWFGIPCELLSDDELLRAARVHLGSLGVVLNLIVETVPLYYLERRITPHQDGDLRWRPVLHHRRPNGADAGHPASPDYLSLILNPYLPNPTSDPRAWLTTMMKRPYSGQAGVLTTPSDKSLKSDLADFLPGLVQLFEDDLELPRNPLLRAITSAQLRAIYGNKLRLTSALPGVMFGPPDFLGVDFHPLFGASAEYVFNATQARTGVETILGALADQAKVNNQYLGGIGVRFVKGSNAWLAPNAKHTNCFVELQSLHTDELPAIHTAVARALTKAQIPYCGHWGQWALNTPAVVSSFWSEKAVTSWKTARATLLPTAKARKIFASPILAGAGLG